MFSDNTNNLCIKDRIEDSYKFRQFFLNLSVQTFKSNVEELLYFRPGKP